MRFIRSLVLAGVTLALLLPASAFASQARIDALGLQPDFVQDYVNVIHYPSTIVKYQNLVYGDLGIKDTDGGDLSEFEDNDETVPALDNSARSMGAHLKLWKNMPGVLGIQFNENATPLSPAYGAEYWNRNRNEGVTLLWGQDFGGVTAGFQFNRTSSELEIGDASSEPFGGTPGGLPLLPSNTRQAMNSINAALGSRPWNTTGFGGGLSFDFDASGRSHTADIGIQYRSMSYEETNAAGTVTDESDGSYGLAINARSQFATSDNTYLVPVINYWNMKLDNQLSDTVTPANDFTAENSVTGWNIGLAESWVLRESDLLTVGLLVGTQEVEYEDPRVTATPFTATYSTTPQLFGSVEVHPMNWFHVRLGASKAFTSRLEVNEDPLTGEPVEWTDSPIGYTVGAGFRIGGRLDLDAVLNQDFAFTGGWAASGNEETPFSRLSATYRW